MKNYCYSNISELSQLICNQKVSPVEIVEICLSRIEKLNPRLNVFITVLGDEALEQAKKQNQK
jgi:aspartyl-tRNA(Asn)/glutamyl-tRNA(Gln) amidotransferase subunit A